MVLTLYLQTIVPMKCYFCLKLISHMLMDLICTRDSENLSKMNFNQSPLFSVYVTVSVIVIFEFMFSAYGICGQGSIIRQAKRERPLPRVLAPCKIFHTLCKNEGKCREKGKDGTWYCECPANCEGFFCEKVMARE